jgi:asparagine synthase (glutamine-hydrolysing)
MTIQPGGEPEIRKYWDAEYPDKVSVGNLPGGMADVQHTQETRTEEEMIAHTRRLLLEAVRIRLRADVPVGIYLSGGIDSSAVAGMAAHLVTEEGVSMGKSEGDTASKVCCFTIAFDETSGFDESGESQDIDTPNDADHTVIAQRTAEFLGVKFLKKHMDEATLADNFEDAVYHIEHHNNDLNFVGKYALSELPRQHGYKVVLTGEGADEHFAGYPLYLPDYLREEDKAMHDVLQMTSGRRQEVVAEQDQVIKNMYEGIGGTSRYFEEKSLGNQLNSISTPASMMAFTPPLSMFSQSIQEQYSGIDVLSTVSNNIDEATKTKIQASWHPLHSALYTWGKGHLTNQFLSCLGDRVEMAHSVEARTPFLDHKLTEYVNGLPPSMKLRHSPTEGHSPENLKADFIEKYALREATKEFITPEIYTRRKHPYTAPTTYPVDGPVHKLLVRLVTKENVDNLGFLDWDAVHSLLRQAFGDGSGEERTKGFRLCLCVAEWIVLAKRFNVGPASSRG